MPNLADQIEHWQNENRQAVLPALLLCAAHTLCAVWFRDYQYGIVRLLPGMLSIFVLLVYAPQALRRLGKKRLAAFVAFGFIVAFFMVAMRTTLAPAGGGEWKPWLLLPLALFTLTYSLCAMGGFVLVRRLDLRCTAGPHPPKKWWLWAFLLMLALWLPYFAAFGPLRISADSYDVISQALGVTALTDSHPVAYTLLVAAFLRPARAAGGILAGAYLLGFVQMACLAATLSFSVYWLRRQGAPRLLCLAAFLLFGLSPVFAVNGITLWKDIPFSCLLLLMMLALYEMAQTHGEWLRERRNTVYFMLLCAGACFARGNGFLVVLAVCALLVCCFKNQAKRLLRLFAPLLLCVLLVRGPLYGALGLTRLGAVESAAMPLQQVGAVVAAGEELSPAQRQVVERFVPLEVIRENFTPTSPDNVKKHPRFNPEAFSDNFGAFLGVWLQLMPKYPQSYLNTWVVQTMGYWKYDFAAPTVYLVELGESVFGIENKDVLYKLTGLNFHQFFANRTAWPTMGMMALITLYAAAVQIASRRARMALHLAPPLALWLGLLAAAPTYSDFRYLFVLTLSLPVICYTALCRPRFDAAKAPG